MKILIGAVSVSKPKYAAIHEAARKVFDTVVLNPYDRVMTADEIRELWTGCSAVLSGNEKYTAQLLANAPPELKVISKHGVGVDNIDLAAAGARGITVCNTPGANADAVAEAALGLILSCLRKIPQAHESVVSGRWKRPEGHLFKGKTLGVIGMGNIGKNVIRCSEGFGVKFMAYDPFFDQTFAQEHNVKKAGIEEILENADIVSLHVPVTDETRNMINREALGKMKKNAVLINTARGDLVNEADLYEALKNGTIAAAGLDVLVKEPELSSPLFSLDNIVITPHLAGNTAETTFAMGMRALENAVYVATGKDGATVVR